MINYIVDLINLYDKTVEVIDVESDPYHIIVHVQKITPSCTCKYCGCNMLSKGIYLRHVNHPILQDGRTLTLVLHRRSWQCPNCHKCATDEFSFCS